MSARTLFLRSASNPTRVGLYARKNIAKDYQIQVDEGGRVCSF